MKPALLIFTLVTMTATAFARDAMVVEGGATTFPAYNDYKAPESFAFAGSDKDMKIASLNKLLEQQQRMYEEKITYLETELKKSKDRLVEKSINHDKTVATMERRFNEESSYLNRELVAKTKTLMEYQRQLEKVKPSEEMKNLIKANTELALEVRRTTDQLAIMQVKGHEDLKLLDDKAPVRMPASVEK